MLLVKADSKRSMHRSFLSPASSATRSSSFAKSSVISTVYLEVVKTLKRRSQLTSDADRAAKTQSCLDFAFIYQPLKCNYFTSLLLCFFRVSVSRIRLGVSICRAAGRHLSVKCLTRG